VHPLSPAPSTVDPRPQHLHEALRDARAEQTTDDWKQTYRARAGIEGTIHQTVAVTGIRQARYTGLAKSTSNTPSPPPPSTSSG
jgi:hypothetical protein